MEDVTQPMRVLVGRYRLIRALGSGGMGTVWLALDELLDRQVAVKEVSPLLDVTENEREMLRERTLREARIAARLRHPNVVTIYDVIEDGGRPWIVMELVPARSLRDVVQQNGPLTPRQAAAIGLQVLAALRAAHATGVMHRDVTPGNVLVGTDGRAVLADFGIARALDNPTVTRSGMLVGSPSYIAPERARGDRGGPESDLWSLGATLYSAVEGRPPYDRGSALATLMAVVTEEPDPPLRAGSLWPVISGLLCRDEARRLGASAAERMLRRIAEPGDTVHATWPAVRATPAGAAGTIRDRGKRGGRLQHAEQTRAFRLDALLMAPPPATDTAHLAVREVWRPEGPAGSLSAAAPVASAPAVGQPAGGRPPAPKVAAERAAASSAERGPTASGATGHPFAAGPVPKSSELYVAGRRRPTWVIAAFAAAAVVVVTLLLTMSAPDSHLAQSRRHGSASTTTAAATRPAAAPASKPVSRRATPAATLAPASVPVSVPGDARAAVPKPGAGDAPLIPAGYYAYHDPSGFSIAVPNGWNVAHEGGYVYIRDPSAARFLLIDQSDHPKPDPLADWRQQEANRISTYPGYQRVRLAAVSYPQAEKAADWEFTYDAQGGRIHVLSRNVLANSRHAYALYWSALDGSWAGSFHFFQVFAATFQPARA